MCLAVLSRAEAPAATQPDAARKHVEELIEKWLKAADFDPAAAAGIALDKDIPPTSFPSIEAAVDRKDLLPAAAAWRKDFVERERPCQAVRLRALERGNAWDEWNVRTALEE